MAAKLNPSKLSGSHRDRVFIGGSYAAGNRKMLTDTEKAVKSAGFVPIVADRYDLITPDRDIHDVTLWLLHACRLAIFEVSTLSGALMELERVSDYGIGKSLLLYQHPGGLAWPAYPDAWRTTQMLKSLSREQSQKLVVRVYTRPKNALAEVAGFLRAIRRSAYGKLHGL